LDDRRMIRTLDDNARAFLSSSYNRLDNDLVGNYALQELMNRPNIEIVSCSVTNDYMYIKAIFTNLQFEARVGDICRVGIVIRTNEIGLGALEIMPFVERLVCTNGMTSKDNIKELGLRRTHRGKRNYTEGIYSQKTVFADNMVFIMKMVDTIRAVQNMKTFLPLVEKIQNSTKTEKIKNPIDAAVKLSNDYGLDKSEHNKFLQNLLEDHDLTQWGAANAITKIANETESYDRASELEILGGQLIELNASQWRKIAEFEVKKAA